MANAKICDRCKCFYKPTAKSGGVSVLNNSGYKDKTYDLCEPCKFLLNDFLKSGKEMSENK